MIYDVNRTNKGDNMTKYLNLKTQYGTETVDELDTKHFCTYKEFRQELNRLVNEYQLSGMNVYVSSRCTKEWA